MKHLTIRELIAALNEIPDNPLVIISGFGTANVPGNVRRHRSHLNDLGIEVVYERMNSKTVERFTRELSQHATQPVTKFNPNPATLDSLAWVRPSMETEQSFFAVTGVDVVKGYAVIRAKNVAPVQGPSVQRVSDEELLRRNAEIHPPANKAERDLDSSTAFNRWLLRAIPADHSAVRLRLEETRAELEKLTAALPKMEVEAARIDYILGITNEAPKP